ncbi:MAG TPA: DUF4215 domain-containing protein [Polyangia bacterium]|jgi:cysteine-rich repeat protein
MRTWWLLLSLLTVGCGERVLSGGRAADAGRSGGDVLGAPDGGSAPADSGSAPADTGPAPADGAPGDAAAPAPDATPGPDGPPAPVCGNGVREGLEACDDGNLEDFDGCSSKCVIEGGTRPVFASLVPQGGYRMAVTGAGEVFLRQTYTAAGEEPFTRISPDGTVSPGGFASQVKPNDCGELIGVGDSVVFGSFFRQSYSAADLSIQRWQPNGVVETLYEEHETTGWWYGGRCLGLAVPRDLSRLYLGLNQLRVVTSASSTINLTPGASPPSEFLVYDDSAGRILAAVGADWYVKDIVRIDPQGGISPFFSLPEGWVSDLAMDDAGHLFVGCATGGGPGELGPCLSAAVWVVSADGAASRPFINAYRYVMAFAFDPSTHELVYVADDWELRRVPVDL